MSRRPSRAWPTRTALLLVSVGLSWLAAEALLHARPSLYRTGYVPSDDPLLVYELDPGHEIPSLHAHISAQGLHDRVFPVEKPLGVQRIALVGDSTAFGWKVPLEESFPKVLERALNERAPGNFEVINFSVPGYDTAQELALLRRKVLGFAPDLVILVFNGNDVRSPNFLQPEPTLLGALARRSLLVHSLLRAIDGRLATPREGGLDFPAWWLRVKHDCLGMFYPHRRIFPTPGLEEVEYEAGEPPASEDRVPPRYHHTLGYAHYAEHLAQIRDLLASRGIPLVSTGPLTHEAARVNRELGIEHLVLGLWPHELAREFYFDGPLVIPGDGHWTAAGHALAARRVLAYLVAHGLVRRD